MTWVWIIGGFIVIAAVFVMIFPTWDLKLEEKFKQKPKKIKLQSRFKILKKS